MPHSLKRAFVLRFSVVILFLLLASAAWAGSFTLIYEKVVKDAAGNEIGTQKQVVSSPADLPYGNPWRAYLENTVDHRNFYQYLKDLSGYFSQPMTLNISDRTSTSCSGKNSAGFYITLYKHVTQFSSVDSKKFVFLHETGHVAMLNAYPSSFDFSGLNYGSDNAHYIDEILPNHKTAWVEGWANCFAALKNGGKVFSLNLSSDTVTAFLKGNTFEEMTRNELFIGKNLFDIIKTLPDGQTKVFNTLSRVGPHYSLEEFCRAYLRLYPGDQINLAKILDKTSYGKITLNEMLRFVNNGSRTVSQSFYNYLAGAGKLNSTTNQTSGQTQRSFWDRISDFFAGLFGRKSATQTAAAAPAVSVAPNEPLSGSTNVSLTPAGEFTPQSQTSDIPTGSAVSASATPADLASAHEAYFQAFRVYNDVMATSSPDSAESRKARENLTAAKKHLETLRQQLIK